MPGKGQSDSVDSQLDFAAKSNLNALSRRSCTISTNQLLSETTEEERFILKQELCTTLLSFIDRDIPVFLDGLGLLSTSERQSLVQREVNGNSIIRNEAHKSLEFEKCDRICDDHRSKFPTIADTKDLAQRIHPQLPTEINIKWTEQDTRRYLRGIIRLAKEHLVREGHSKDFDPVVHLFCIQSDVNTKLDKVSVHDVFAASEIFIKSNYKQLVNVGPSKVYQAPVLESAWELLEAAYNAPLTTIEVDVARELAALDYEFSAEELESLKLPEKLKVAAFLTSQDQDSHTFLLATDGLRSLAYGESGSVGNELTLQAVLKSDSVLVPSWIHQCLSLGVLVLCSSVSKQIRPGLMIETDKPLVVGKHSSFSAVLTTSFQPVKQAMRSADGQFQYVNLVGIGAPEVVLAKKFNPKRVLALLEYKKRDQVTDIDRRPIVRSVS